jgi:hypothetical protein
LPTRFASGLAAGLLLLLAATAAHAQSLHEKAERFRADLVTRHWAEEGVVLYRVRLERVEDDLRVGTYPNLADTPTFTGQLAAAACTRIGVESDSGQARADAARALDGLAFLMRVTGRPGLMARAIRRDHGVHEEGLRGKWLTAPPPLEGYRFRADVSADQYANGLLPAVAACAPHFRERSRALVTAAAEHLLEHDMQLVDPDGQRTTYGDLGWRSGRGFNSIFQLTGLGVFMWAAELDDSPRWARQRDRLRDHYRVVARGRTTNLRLGALTNFSNDMMAWNVYRALVPLMRRDADPALPDMRHGMHRTWLRVRDDQNAYFALVLCHVEPESCDEQALAQARQQLEHFPVDKRKRAPSPELDALPRRLLPDDKLRPQARDPVPMQLRPVSSLEWKSSPYRVTGDVRPDTEYTGIDYLGAYWLLRAVEAARAE